MKKKFWYLTKVSLEKKIKTKWFLITNIILALVIMCLININTIIKFFGGDFSDEIQIYVVDNIGGYELFQSSLNALDEDENIKVYKKDVDAEKLDKGKVLISLDADENGFLEAKITSYEKIDNTIYQKIITSLNSTKSTLGLIKSNIDPNLLTEITKETKVDRDILSDSKNVDENMELVMNSVFPTLILQFFMLVIFLVQMVGGEICEEKTTRSMEIIISNISPKLHLASKVLASNIFVIFEGLLLLIYAAIGLILHKFLNGTSLISDIKSIFSSLNLEFLLDKLYIVIPLTFILMVLSFIAYATLSGILASMTVNIEDFNQLQTPIMLISVAGYYLAITASMFNGSTFIHIASYIPFLSSFLSPTLYIIGEITLPEMLLSIVIMILFIYILLKKGMKIYKNGILNYSNDKVWSRVRKTIKNS